jgi:transposase InsO family protein
VEEPLPVKESAPVRRERRHIAFVEDLIGLGVHDRKTSSPTRRALKREVRQRVMAFARWLDGMGRASPGGRGLNAASLLGIGAAWLNHWNRRWRSGRRKAGIQGRPSAQAAAEARAKAVEVFQDLGPSVSVATLRGLCPELGRNEAERLVKDLRQECREEHSATVNALQWMRPGTVWAIDHAEPPTPIDGVFRRLLVVRDLASHCTLAAIPQQAATARATAHALADLFARHGAPLVIKHDNHGAFTGKAVRRLLEKRKVLALVSPPYLPRYNGAVEAGIGSLKVWAHFLASKAGHPESWTADLVEGALLLMNRLHWPWGKDKPTPEARWNARAPIAEMERGALRRRFEVRLAVLRRNPANLPPGEGAAPFRIVRTTGGAEGFPGADGPNHASGESLPRWAQAWNAALAPTRRRRRPAAAAGSTRRQKDADASGEKVGQRRNHALQCGRIEREALKGALEESGQLVIRRRRIPLPIKRLIRLKISGA